MVSSDETPDSRLAGRASGRRPAHHRLVRSFVRREGRLTPAQARALEELYPVYGLEHPGPLLEPAALFCRDAPLTLEIGFGNGEALLAEAAAHPERDYLGIEVHRPGVGRVLNQLRERDLENVRVICADAVEVLGDRLPAGCLDACWIFFPDPWPKKRHHKRRLVQAPFLGLLADKLRPGGIVHAATDWTDYAEWMREALDASPALQNTASAGEFAGRPAWRPETRFERRGQARGHEVYDLIYRKR